MLGILLGVALAILMGVILHHYRLGELGMDVRFQQSLYWAKIGAACFIGQVILILSVTYYSLIVSFYYFSLHVPGHESPFQMLMAHLIENPLYPFMWMGGWRENATLVLIFLVPMVSVGLVLLKLIKPLSEKKAPSRNWFYHIGIFSTAAFGGSLGLSFSCVSIDAMLRGLPNLLFFFIVLCVGVFAIQTSGYRLTTK